MIDRIGSHEGYSPTDASFTSGQLGGDVYEATRPAEIGQYGYEGCVYALAGWLEGGWRRGDEGHLDAWLIACGPPVAAPSSANSAAQLRAGPRCRTSSGGAP